MVTKKIKMKNKDGVVTECDIGAKAENVTQDASHRFVSDTEKDTWNKKANAEEANQSKAGLLSASDKKKLDGVEEGANKYTHPSTSGNKHIPSGGSAGQVLKWSADGTAVWGEDKDTTYAAFKAATSSAAGGAGLVPAPAAGNHDDYLRGDGKWGAASDMVQTFSQASSRANIASGEANKTLFGKIAKWFADLGGSGIAAFAKIVNNGTTTVANTVLDGRFGKILLDRIVAAEKNITTINSSLDYFNAADDITGSNFQKNFWLINRNDKTSEINKNSFFALTQADRDEWENIPPDMPNQTIIGMREVFVRNSQHVLVQITEFHPIAGRRYCSMYNNGLWSDWQTYNPS